jgi:hypothetical protein
MPRMKWIPFVLFLGAGQAFADPALTPQQQAKLDTLQAMFRPGGSTNSGGYGIEKAEEFCGAAIPLDVDPSMVLYDKPDMTAERSDISSVCHAAAGAVVYVCGSSSDADPVVKQLVRDNVKRIVCKTTKNPAEVSATDYQRWALDRGTLTYTCLAGHGCGNITETGMAFLRKNVKSATGLSIGGQELKVKLLASYGPSQNSLVKSLEEECGIKDLVVTIEDKLAEHYTEHTGHNPGTACDAGLQSVYNLCARGNEFAELNKAAVKAATKKHLKGVACVYSDTESIAIKPGGILELGVSYGAPRPKYKGRSMSSIHDLYMRWLADNVKAWGK